MHASAQVLAWPAGHPNWMLLFAREPEPDVEFTEEDLDEPVKPRSSSQPTPPKRSGGRSLLWIFLLVLAGGAAYVSLEPDIATDLLSAILGDTRQQAKAGRPTATPDGFPKPASPVTAQNPASTPMAPAPPAAPAPASRGEIPVPAPLFGEGQQVTAVLDPTSPGDSITLSLDPAGTKPGSTIRPGMTLIILDGELSNNNWVYAVRVEDGSRGWILERRLRLKS